MNVIISAASIFSGTVR